MKIEHIALYVNDLEGAKHFFTAYFGGKPNAGYQTLRTNKQPYAPSTVPVLFAAALL